MSEYNVSIEDKAMYEDNFVIEDKAMYENNDLMIISRTEIVVNSFKKYCV